MMQLRILISIEKPSRDLGQVSGIENEKYKEYSMAFGRLKKIKGGEEPILL